MNSKHSIPKTLIIVLLGLSILTGGANSSTVISSVYNITELNSAPHITYNNSSDIPVIPIHLCNYQNVSTTKDFQQLIQINWSLYSQYLNSNISNVRFYNQTSSIGKLSGYGVLPAWIESNNSTTAASSNVWINLSGTIIPANGCKTIYMAFLPKNVNWNSYLGINPYLDPAVKYGYGDNGNNVFLLYNNGKSLMPLTNTGVGGSGPEITSNAPSLFTHAITGTVNGGGANANSWTTNGITNTSNPSFNLPTSYIVQFKVYLSGSSALTDLLTNVNSIKNGNFYVFRLDSRDSSTYNEYDLIGYYPVGASQTTPLNYSGNFVSKTGKWYQLTAIDNNDHLYLYKSGAGYYMNQYGVLEESAKGKGYTGGGIAVTTDGASSTDYWSLIIVRYLPPNNVMPSFIIGNIFIKNTGNQFFSNKITNNENNATLTLTSIWDSGMYVDDNGNVFWTDTYGNVMVNYSNNLVYPHLECIYSLPPLHEFYPLAGPVSSISAVNITTKGGNVYAFVTLLTVSGYIYSYNVTNKTWFNASNLWKINLDAYPAPWTSVTSNVNGYTNKNTKSEYFYFSDIYGNIYQYNIIMGKGKWFYTQKTNVNPGIIATSAYYNEYQISNNALFGISSSSLYELTASGWNNIGPAMTGLISITIGSQKGSDYIYLLNESGYLYQSKENINNIASPVSFNSPEKLFTGGEASSISGTTSRTNSYSYQFNAIEINGTMGVNQGNGWTYLKNELPIYSYQPITINSTYLLNFSAYSEYINSTDIASLTNFSLYFLSNKTALEFESNGSLQLVNTAMPSLLNTTQDILVYVNIRPYSFNTAFIHFNILFYCCNNINSIVIIYNLNIEIINHFYYEVQ
ncbi:MAG: hypothetical protein ACP5FQ_06470 [Thermoplasmata archaeon]